MKNYQDLLDLVHKIHTDCFFLCKKVLGEYLLTAGNIGIFCQSEEEYGGLTEFCRELTLSSDNPNQKYFQLITPIVIPKTEDIPETVYEYLYVRKPASDSPQRGDVDFVLGQEEFKKLKQKVSNNEVIGASVYNRPGWDTIEIRDNNISALGYVSTQEMAEKVRAKFDLI